MNNIIINTAITKFPHCEHHYYHKLDFITAAMNDNDNAKIP